MYVLQNDQHNNLVNIHYLTQLQNFISYDENFYYFLS